MYVICVNILVSMTTVGGVEILQAQNKWAEKDNELKSAVLVESKKVNRSWGRIL